MSSTKRIRNFSIIAHIDHGKSTLADRILEFAGTIDQRDMKNQYLDRMDIERERGITIKSQTVRINYKASDGKDYQLNLIDTPGHVDFSYEVSRALAACEGALLVVDASQGVEAQTYANTYLAIDNDLYIIPVVNKIDLPSANPEKTLKEIEIEIGIDVSEHVLVSAKQGLGIKNLLETIVSKIPAPEGNDNEPFKALIFDSWYDNYRGVVILIRVMSGKIKAGDTIIMYSTKEKYMTEEVGIFSPEEIKVKNLGAGEVGYVMAGLRDIKKINVGDTIVKDIKNSSPLVGFKAMNPMIFAGIYPANQTAFENLRKGMEKLNLNDSAFVFTPENSVALGFGFRCGFLGLLHLEVVQERLEREYGVDLITTAPTVKYRVNLYGKEAFYIENPKDMPQLTHNDKIEEPIMMVTIHSPRDYIGSLMTLCTEKRGIHSGMTYAGEKRIILLYKMPLNEIIFDFYDKLKTISRGYASMDYEFLGYEPSELVKVNILVNGESVDALSLIAHKSEAYSRGKDLVTRLRKVIPRQLFDVAVQAAVGRRIIARETVKAMRKNVLAKCYGGDVSRKRKLLEKQKEGKKRMKHFGNVDIPQEAFLTILKV